AAVDLPADVHPVFRQHTLVSPSDLPLHARRGAGRHGLDARGYRSHAPAAITDRRVLRRLVSRVHVLPWRALATQALAAVPDALLPDGVARRSDRLGSRRPRGAARPAGVFRAGARTRRLRGAARVPGPTHALRIHRAFRRIA